MIRPFPAMNDALAKLPLFATDAEIAVAIVGKSRAEHWRKYVLPNLRNFPKKDELQGGWPTPLVWKYYETYLALGEDFLSAGGPGKEKLEVWTKSQRRVKASQPSDNS
jgi:hypothetical protein